MDSITVDLAATLTALSVLITTIAALWTNLRSQLKKNTQITEETREAANGNLTEAYRRIDQLKTVLMQNHIDIPPFLPPKDGKEEI